MCTPFVRPGVWGKLQGFRKRVYDVRNWKNNATKIICVFLYRGKIFRDKLLYIWSTPWTQGLNQKHEEYSDNWCLGFCSIQSTDNFMCAVKILVLCHLRKHVVNFVNVGNKKAKQELSVRLSRAQNTVRVYRLTACFVQDVISSYRHYKDNFRTNIQSRTNEKKTNIIVLAFSRVGEIQVMLFQLQTQKHRP